MKTLKELNGIFGGAVYKHDVSFYILSPGDTLTTPDFVVSYPDAGGPSSIYTLNGSEMTCTKQKDDNTWTEPSAISDSFFSKNTLCVQTDENFMYLELTSLIPNL